MINRRLASRFTHLQIERVLRAEAIAELLAAQVDRSLKQALKKRQAADIAEILAELPDRLTRLADTAFRRLAEWSHREAVSVLVRTLPRRWFRAVTAATVLVGESHGALAGQGGGLVSGRGTVAGWENDDPLQFDNGVEPIIGKKLTDAEWSAWVQQHVFPAPDAATVQEIIQRDVNGVTWQERLRKLSRRIQPEVTALRLSEAFADGKDVDEITRDLLPHITGGVRSSAQRIARTEGLRIANTMQRRMYDDIGDLLAGIQILATLDERTRPEHAFRNGRIHYTDRRRRPNVDTLPDLPDRPNCRCFDVPVMKLPEELKDDPSLAAQFQNAAGNAIPDPLEYQDWFRTADRQRRELAVGRRRYREMIRKLGREPEWADFVKPDGTLISLKRLQAETDFDRTIRRRYVQDVIAYRRQQIQDVKAGGFELPDGPDRLEKPKKFVPRAQSPGQRKGPLSLARMRTVHGTKPPRTLSKKHRRYSDAQERRAIFNQVQAAQTWDEAKGVVYANRQMKRLGYELQDVSLHYRGNQGLDLIFFNGSRYAVVEAKHGDGLELLKTDTEGLRQGSCDYNVSRLDRYLQFGDGTHNQLVDQLMAEADAGHLESFATLYRSDRVLELPDGWPGVSAINR